MDNFLLGNNAQFYKFPFRTFLEAQTECGITDIDLTLIVPHIYVDSEEFVDCCYVSDLLKSSGIRVCSVTPMPYRYSICAAPGSVQWEKTLNYYRNCIRYAAFCGAKYVCITASGAEYDIPEKTLLFRACNMLSLLAQEAEAQGVMLLLGTVLGHESPDNETTPVLTTLKDVLFVLRSVNLPSLAAYLDTLPMSLTGETIPQWFDTLGDAIRLVRFVDGNYNGYRLWGEGCLPCRKYLQQLQECGYSDSLSMNIPGDRYSTDPKTAQVKNLAGIRRSIGQ